MINASSFEYVVFLSTALGVHSSFLSHPNRRRIISCSKRRALMRRAIASFSAMRTAPPTSTESMMKSITLPVVVLRARRAVSSANFIALSFSATAAAKRTASTRSASFAASAALALTSAPAKDRAFAVSTATSLVTSKAMTQSTAWMVSIISRETSSMNPFSATVTTAFVSSRLHCASAKSARATSSASSSKSSTYSTSTSAAGGLVLPGCVSSTSCFDRRGVISERGTRSFFFSELFNAEIPEYASLARRDAALDPGGNRATSQSNAETPLGIRVSSAWNSEATRCDA
mmetsp:Transcript_2431/g.8425  ORF Transcript_2431/g.8425 Transcript_2431/m.8425 type:complete len:289 (+) Transcript_2431:875-1741(+)